VRSTTGSSRILEGSIFLAIMVGVAGAIGIFFTWRGQRLTQQSLEDTRKNTQEQLENAREELRNAQEQLDLSRESTEEQLRLTR